MDKVFLNQEADPHVLETDCILDLAGEFVASQL